MVNCKYCGGNDVEYSESRGETYCTKCGAVLEENRMVESVSFAETSSGAVRAVGQFIPSSFGGGFAMSYGSRESREQALQRGYSHIQRIADRLRIPLNLVEAAQRVYLMGVQRSFTMGRLSSHVAAACLYISCRREKSPQMLIDFSDVLTTPVKTLGAIFVKLLRVLHIHVPTIDPSLFMERFAAQIPLGDKTNAVSQTGVRLVQAMARDWISTGRRPTGLCGAALLIAARYHGVKINAEDISTVIRMSASTVNKRLSEFRQTSTAQLKSSEFETTDLLSLPALDAPPCLRLRNRKRRQLALAVGEEEPYQLTDDSAHPERPSLTMAQDDHITLAGAIKITADEDEICDATPSSSCISSLAQRMLGAIENQVSSGSRTQSTVAATQDPCNQTNSTNESGDDMVNKSSVGNDELLADDGDDTLGELLRDVKEKAPILVQQPVEVPVGNSILLAAESLPNGDILDETLSDVSEDEINWMILSSQEKDAKTLMWDELMKDVMPEVHKRWREKRRKEKEQCNRKPRKKHAKIDIDPGATPADSVRAALETKNRSIAKRLNTNALQSLLSGSQMLESPISKDICPVASSYQSLFD